MRYNKCPRCGGETRCLAGHSAHWRNWFCANETGCGWQAWNQATSTSPTKDTRDETLRATGRMSNRVEALVQVTEGGVEIYDRKEMLTLARKLERENAELREQLEQAEGRCKKLEQASERVRRWDEHGSELARMYGSNGVRDYYRKILADALRL